MERDRANSAIGETIGAVRDYIRRHHLLKAGDSVVAAVSGGVDSACLLACLTALRDDLGITILAAHLDHGLRGPDEAAADIAIVTELAQRLGVPLTHGHRDVPTLRRGEGRGMGDEATARRARYEFLHDVARATGIPEALIAVAHTASDQAETVLLHLLRGSGPHGLSGMAPRHGQVIRPLLGITRAQTEAVCATLALPTRTDPTNASPRYTRNRVRQVVLPLLRTFNPQIDAALVRLAAFSAADTAYLEEQAQRGLAGAYRLATNTLATNAHELYLDLARWAALDVALRPHGLRLLLSRLFGSADGFTAKHIGDILAYLDSLMTHPGRQRSIGQRASYPHGLRIGHQDGQAIFSIHQPSPGSLQASDAPEPWAVELPLPGEVILPGGRGRLRADILLPGTWSHADAMAGTARSVMCDLRAVLGVTQEVRAMSVATPVQTGIQASLRVRSRQSGDVIRPLGMAGHRKVQDILVDARIPRAQRNDVPLVTVNTGSMIGGDESQLAAKPASVERIIWIAGLCLADDVRLDGDTRSAVRLTWIAERQPEP